MEINQTNTTPTASQSASTNLASDLDTFLTLLTAQLQYQDPLEPLDTAEFTNQLVQFSGVEQSIQTNSNLEELIALTQTSAGSTAVAYLGKDVSIASKTATLANGEAKWAYDLSAQASDVSISILNSSGTVVYSTNGTTSAGSNNFVWDGKDSSGTQLPDGSYTMSISAVDADGDPIAVSASVGGRVTGVDLQSSPPSIKVGSSIYTLDEILAIEEPPTESESS